MKYQIELDAAVAGFFEEIARVTQRPTEDVLSDALRKQVEMLARQAASSCLPTPEA